MPNDRPNLPAVVVAALPMSPEQVRDHVNAIQKVMQAVMKKDVHYGTIPGTPKPTLYKPGAEMLCMTFHIDPAYDIEDLSTADYYRYRVRCIGKHQQTGIKLGEGMGSASSNEEKYKWRKAVCDEEFEIASESRRRLKFGKSKDGVYRVKQIRAEPDDIDNTVLKMACKRAHIAMTLNVLAASDIFTQDIEDLPEHLRSAEAEAQPNPELLAKWVAAAAGAKDAEALKAVYEQGKAELRELDDAATYAVFKAKVEELLKAFKGSDLPAYPDDAFAKNLPGWRKHIASGKRTADDVVAMLRSKNTLTKEQEDAIRAPTFDPAAALADVKAKAEAAALTDTDVAKALGVKALDALTEEQYQKALAFIADPAGGAS